MRSNLMEMAPVDVTIRPRLLVAAAAVISAALVLVGGAIAVLRVYNGETLGDTTWLLDLGNDSALPTWFAAAFLGVAAALLWWLGALERHDGDRRSAKRWWLLAVGVLLCSMDEVATVHETAGGVIGDRWSGYFAYGWVVLGLAIVGVAAVVLGPFVFRLPDPLRFWLLLAAACYLGGALGMEMVNARTGERMGATESYAYVLGTAFEEALELAGVVILLHGLSSHLAGRAVDLRMRVRWIWA